MAGCQLVIKGDRFELPNRERKRRIVNNEWKCFFKSNTAISCINENHYTDKYMFKIYKDGNVVWLKQRGDNEAEVLKIIQLEKWPIDGVIELPTILSEEDKEATEIFLSESRFQVI